MLEQKDETVKSSEETSEKEKMISDMELVKFFDEMCADFDCCCDMEFESSGFERQSSRGKKVNQPPKTIDQMMQSIVMDHDVRDHLHPPKKDENDHSTLLDKVDRIIRKIFEKADQELAGSERTYMFIEALILYLLDYSSPALRTLDTLILFAKQHYSLDVVLDEVKTFEGELAPTYVLIDFLKKTGNFSSTLDKACIVLLNCKLNEMSEVK